MMSKIFSVSKTTFYVTLRQNFCVLFLFFAMLFVAASYFLGRLSIQEMSRIVMNTSLLSAHIFSVLFAIFIGTSTLWQEEDRFILHNALSKAIKRWEYFLGKYLGLLYVLFLMFFVFLVTDVVLFYFLNISVHLSFCQAMGALFFESALILAIAMFFSTFTQPLVGIFATLAIYIVGSYVQSLRLVPSLTSGKKAFLEVLYYLLPNFSRYDISSLLSQTNSMPWGLLFFLLMYSFIFIVITLLLSILVFNCRQLR
ncbi:MAG: hypothetical protein ACE365_01175 [Gammaproteobacteria bacterium]